MPEMIPVRSTNVAAVGFDESSDNLYVRFHDSGTYVYFSVDRTIFDAFLNASSKGRFLDSQIKGRYRYKKIS
jgi:hypothetical protein